MQKSTAKCALLVIIIEICLFHAAEITCIDNTKMLSKANLTDWTVIKDEERVSVCLLQSNAQIGSISQILLKFLYIFPSLHVNLSVDNDIVYIKSYS